MIRRCPLRFLFVPARDFLPYFVRSYINSIDLCKLPLIDQEAPRAHYVCSSWRRSYLNIDFSRVRLEISYFKHAGYFQCIRLVHASVKNKTTLAE